VLEALASGLHVLTCDFLRDVFDDFEKLGYLEYLPADPGLFAERIKQILENKQLINVDKMNQHTYISENYDWKVISEKFYNFIHKCFEDSRIGTEV
jgi:glycosyltransferase involved in cell wall biosynthesis